MSSQSMKNSMKKNANKRENLAMFFMDSENMDSIKKFWGKWVGFFHGVRPSKFHQNFDGILMELFKNRKNFGDFLELWIPRGFHGNSIGTLPVGRACSRFAYLDFTHDVTFLSRGLRSNLIAFAINKKKVKFFHKENTNCSSHKHFLPIFVAFLLMLPFY